MRDGYSSSLLRKIAFFQGVYYLLSGLWSLVDIDSFQMVTGPKTDLWLVKTVGLMVMVSGLVFVYSAVRGYFPVETVLLAVGNAIALACIEVYYVSIDRISFIYMLDAVLEILLAGLWIFAIGNQSQQHRQGKI